MAGTNVLTPTSIKCPKNPLRDSETASLRILGTWPPFSNIAFSYNRSFSSSAHVFPPRPDFSIARFSSAISRARFDRAIAAASARSRMTPLTPVRPGPIPIDACCCSSTVRCSSKARRRSASESYSYSAPSSGQLTGVGEGERDRTGEVERDGGLKSFPERINSSILPF